MRGARPVWPTGSMRRSMGPEAHADGGLLAAAREHARQGRFEPALDACREAITGSPGHAAAWRLCGELELRLGRLQPARDALTRAVQLAPDSAATRISLSRCLLRAGDATDAVAQIEAAVAIEPAQAAVQNQAGELLGRLGRLDQAAALFRRASQLDPNLMAAQFNIAMADLARGDMDAALVSLQTVTGRWPGLAVGWLQLGGVLNAFGRYLEAERALRRHLELDTDSVAGQIWLGAALQFQGRFDQAGHHYRAALERDPENPDALANLGKLLQAQGEPDQAESCFRRALAADPSHDQARSGLAAWLDNQGRQTDALALLDQTPGADPGVVAPIRARLLRRSGRWDEARSVLETALTSPTLAAEGQVQLRFSLAHLLDELGDYEAAWSAAETANSLRRQSLPAGVPTRDLVELEHGVAATRAAFSADAMKALPRASVNSSRPVFIVGMPRSGKSLAEQILCSHPRVHGAGELTEIGETSAMLGQQTGGWPAGVQRVTEAMLDQQAERYLARLHQRAGDADRVTDTMPFNFVHLGLIELMFPQALVIRCVRHPLDLILRCWLKNFAGRSLAFTFELEAMAVYFSHYQNLMAHWREVSELPILELPYERLVAEPASWSRRLVEFVGLDWDPRCLQFYEPGIATSAADTPLREPLSNREVGAWRHYQRWLEPYADALDVHGYEHRTG